MRLRRSNPRRPGLARRRRGRGASYTGPDGTPVTDRATLDRLRALAIPPAWRDVWICPDPRGHLQATGVDAAGRRQYLYHPAWREHRDAAKFDRVAAAATRLPRLRRRVAADLDRTGLHRDRVLAVLVALLDSGAFRVGGEESAAADDPTYGLTTLRRAHVRSRRGAVELRYAGKGGVAVRRVVADPRLVAVLRRLRRAPGERLFRYWDRAGRRWCPVRGEDVNAYLRTATGTDFTAKDFRSWWATVHAAASLATRPAARSGRARQRAVRAVMVEVAELLSNTPAVARASYVDPRVLDRYADGDVAAVPADAVSHLDNGDSPARRRIERAVRTLLTTS
ncbi:DNA topoisomerase [Pilimelia anulata]|uniref:DNA topoisomerase n=1 Tax=Pilimelia anulata TaxID=53371 RepID=A0A8J3F8I3_9ACTN|nr:DNA topoisomerase IB [Pilimelia anulata]GGJ87270.1 DNA topoisomerase [Pilimelia anulata]